jgi:hypothetical protein
MLTGVGGGLLLAKNCLIAPSRNELNQTRAPTSAASSNPTMMNQRTIRTGRALGFSAIGLPAI